MAFFFAFVVEISIVLNSMHNFCLEDADWSGEGNWHAEERNKSRVLSIWWEVGHIDVPLSIRWG